MGRIVTIICIVVLIVGGIWVWRNYHKPNPYDGYVSRRDAAMENGTTTMENGQNIEEAHPSPSRSDAPGTINTEPVHGYPDDRSLQTEPLTQDPYASGPYDRNARNVPPPPPGDSEPAESPNGYRFAGSGVYQWYRQGDITYRVNTQTGASCIIYATMEEWRKPDVYRHGCRGR